MAVYFKGADGWYRRTEGEAVRKVTCLLWDYLDLLEEMGHQEGSDWTIAASQPDYISWPQERDKYHVGYSEGQ